MRRGEPGSRCGSHGVSIHGVLHAEAPDVPRPSRLGHGKREACCHEATRRSCEPPGCAARLSKQDADRHVEPRRSSDHPRCGSERQQAGRWRPRRPRRAATPRCGHEPTASDSPRQIPPSEAGHGRDLGPESRSARGGHERAHPACTASSAGPCGGAPEVERLRRRGARWRARAATFSTTRAALRAAIVPIDTWSSLLAEVGIESTLAGWESTLFSETSAAAVTCGIMKPEFSPRSRREERGEARRGRGSRSRSMRRSRDRRRGRSAAIASEVERHRHRLRRGSCRRRAPRAVARRRPAGCRWRRSISRSSTRAREARARRARRRAPAACSAAQ